MSLQHRIEAYGSMPLVMHACWVDTKSGRELVGEAVVTRQMLLIMLPMQFANTLDMHAQADCEIASHCQLSVILL